MNKKEIYEQLLIQIRAITTNEKSYIANMANVSSLIMNSFHFLWVGFYIVEDGELVLGPFQGPVACTRIKKGRGVCGTTWEKSETIIVPDVEKFPGHIACNSLSRSEIVVPIFKNNNVIAVLDIDSTDLNTFNHIDKDWLEEIATFIYIN